MSDKIWRGLWWLTIKALKLPLYALVALIYLGLATAILIDVRYYLNKYNNPDEKWMMFHTPLIRGKVLIPKDIVNSKDCEKFFKWEYENIPLFMHGKCPWYEYTPLYPVRIGSLELNIPRKYLFLSASTDRYSNIITTKSWIYPSMEIEKGRLTRRSFWFTLEERWEDDRYKNAYDKYLQSFLHIDLKKNKHQIIPLGFDTSTEMHKYRFDERSDTLDPPRTFEKFVYTNDDINEPINFIVCPKEYENASCESVFKYKDIYINYQLNMSLLPNYKDIQSQIVKMINDWEVKE